MFHFLRNTQLLFYYVGHGSFSESKDYFLPILKTRGPDFEGTSIRLEALAKIIKAAARDVRSHLIFDACFSAATFQAFLSTGPADVAVQKTLQVFPSSGIALLCSAGRSDPALAPEGLRETMFTGEMMRILREGDRTAPARMSFGDLAELSGLGRIVGMIFGMSGGVAALLFAGSVGLFGLRRWRPSVPMLGPKSSTPREWEEYEIMDGLRARDAVPLIGNSTIGRPALTATMLMTLAALLIWAYFNWTN